MSEWQSIETAPKDGSRVLVFKEGQVAAANWDGDWAEWMTTKSTIFPAPTHWQPLPEPPK